MFLKLTFYRFSVIVSNGGGLEVFAWALFFVVLLGAMFFETNDWVAGAGLALAVPMAGITHREGGGKMIEGVLAAVIVLLLLFFASWGVTLAVTIFLLIVILSAKLLGAMNLFPRFEEDEEEDATDEGVIVRR